VQRLRAQGTRLSCLGDLLLERWPGPTIGITGTAGKTSTTEYTAAILRRAGVDLAVSRGARAGNLWPTADLLDQPPVHQDTVLLLELTSSHLAFMSASPTIAAVVSFWPDHLELHGSLARYRSAKETIVRHQMPGDAVIVNADDESAAFATSTPARRFEASTHRAVERGAYLDPARGAVVRTQDVETELGHIEEGVAHPANVVAAAAIATAAGAGPKAIAAGIAATAPPPWRAQAAGTLAGVPAVDDGMAATPLKTAALLRTYPDRSIVLIAGGLDDAGGGQVHAAPEEVALLERACDEVARVARHCIVFGEAGLRLGAALRTRGVDSTVTDDLEGAVSAARRYAPGSSAVVFSPLFPVSLDDRARFAKLLDAAR
jgi:UDP-N-acetylmuramoylalanine--D-glutamate ligase